jgi:hypothetical protein
MANIEVMATREIVNNQVHFIVRLVPETKFISSRVYLCNIYTSSCKIDPLSQIFYY